MNQGKNMNRQIIGFGVLTAGVCGSGVLAQEGFDNDHGYMLIGDPGNRATEGDEIAFPLTFPIGNVDHEFRLAKLEMTLRKQVEFVEAYSPIYFKNNPTLSQARNEFSGWDLEVRPGSVELTGRSLDIAGTMGWEYAARYINWLHHGKVNEEWAFETGVYDTSTFGCVEIPCNYPATHTPEARYWIPSLNEWVKAAHWDPDKDGGAGGYWIYPNRTNEALRPELLPEDGGQRNAGLGTEISFPLDVGSFPNEASPWGILDLAGGEAEWFENFANVPSQTSHRRGLDGTDWLTTSYNYPYDPFLDDYDQWNWFTGRGVFTAFGIRIARMADDPADIDQNGKTNWFDVSEFLNRFLVDDLSVDFRADGVLDADDVLVFLGLFEQVK